jgi:ATP-binding cassette, subfamily B, bacterial
VLKIQRAMGLVWQSSPNWAGIHLIITAAQSLLPIGLLYAIQPIVNSIVKSTTVADKSLIFGEILWWLVIAGLLMLSINLTNLAVEISAMVLAQRVTDRVQVIIYQKAIEVDLEAYEDPQYQDLLERAKWEAPYRPTRLLQNLTGVGQGALSLVAIAIVLCSLHWALICVLILAGLPTILVRFRQSRITYNWHRRQTEIERKANYFGHLLLGDRSAKEIRLFAIGELLIARFTKIKQQLFTEKLAISLRQSGVRLGIQSLTTIVILGAYGFIIERTISGKIQPGELVIYSQVFQRAQGAIGESIANLAGLHEHNLFLNDLFEFLALEPTVVSPSAPQLIPQPLQQGIVFNNVSFRYRNSTRTTLDRIDLTIAPGEIVALVGENGSGKSTLVKLLCRLYDVTTGSITVDGIDLRQLELADWHRQIGALFQDFNNYQLSAADNIWLGNTAMPPNLEVLQSAARKSGADAAIESLPQAYETLLGKWFREGSELSGGQWQKIALARAFMRDARLVILDEPSSAMDALAEEAIFRQFRELMRDRAALLITHRLATVKMADRICVMAKGQIVESGTHDRLIALGGIYCNLFQTQAKNYQ